MPEIYATNNLVEVVKKSPFPSTFLGDRYFPTTARDIFKTPKVYIERSDDGYKAAPFVVPYSGAELMVRDGYTGEQLTPAFINPARDMTIDTLKMKGIGETEYDEVTPEEREQNYLADDMVYLEKAITRRIEWMRGQILTKGYADCTIGNSSAEDKKNMRLQYFEGESFPNIYTFSTKWSDGADKYAQISEIANDVDGEYGDLDMILGKDLVTPFLSDEKILKMLDVSNATFGAINPGSNLPDGVGYIGHINFGGRALNIYSYNAKANVGGVDTYYIDPEALIVLPRSGFGATKYGCISQFEEEDRQVHTRSGQMVPRRITDVKNNMRTLEMASAPLPHPYSWDSWRVAFPNK